ncbi:MAG: hypothetical protein LBV47_04610 [Bacteroidales bacterium]|jgi:hypothetical protein|nr:hypothetical protein [Bacteroidales bacterium]
MKLFSHSSKVMETETIGKNEAGTKNRKMVVVCAMSMGYAVCPHYDAYGKRCKLYDTYQEDYQRQTYCLSAENWTRCPNYEGYGK